MDETAEITKMIHARNDGADIDEALDKILPLVYNQLRCERSNHTLQTTDLINEAYLKIIRQQNVNWESRTHFSAICAKLMRRVLIDYARQAPG